MLLELDFKNMGIWKLRTDFKMYKAKFLGRNWRNS